MSPTRLDEAGDLTVADVTHSRFNPFEAGATVGEVREWFEASASHHLALVADDGRYVGSLVAADLENADPAQPVAALAVRGPTVAPDEPAARGGELALSTPALRVPVVDREGRLRGIVAITSDRQGFCGTGGE